MYLSNLGVLDFLVIDHKFDTTHRIVVTSNLVLNMSIAPVIVQLANSKSNVVKTIVP